MTAKKILIVDDEKNMLDVLRKKMKEDGYEVLLATNGQEAGEKIFQEHPDLILLDILLPKVSGIEVCKRMKAENGLAKVPIIFFTSIDTPKNLIDFAGYGAVDYLHKSIPPETLVEQIRSAIQTVA